MPPRIVRRAQLRSTACGDQDRVVALPVPSPCGLALGGADGQTLYITTARHVLSLEALASAPLSGRMFRVRLQPLNDP